MGKYHFSIPYACSSVDRAMVSGTMCGGSIPFRRTIEVMRRLDDSSLLLFSLPLSI